MLPDLGVGAGTWLLLLVATCLVCLLAAVSAGRLPVRHESLEAVAVGIVLALLVEVVPRLTANTTVGLALAMRALAAPDLRGPLTTDGPVVIQNGMTALLFGTFLVSLRFPSGGVSGRMASLWVAAFALAALADGLANANARGPWSASMLVSFVFVEATRAFGLGCALSDSSLDPLGVAAAGGACGGAAVLGSGVGRALGFEAATVIATPVLLVAAVLLVVSMSRRLTGTRNGAWRTLIGFGVGLGASRLLVANAL